MAQLLVELNTEARMYEFGQFTAAFAQLAMDFSGATGTPTCFNCHSQLAVGQPATNLVQRTRPPQLSKTLAMNGPQLVNPRGALNFIAAVSGKLNCVRVAADPRQEFGVGPHHF
jgi:hypothetical protein